MSTAMIPLTIQSIPVPLTVCQLPDGVTPPDEPMCFYCRTDEERSLVCPTALVPQGTEIREDGWLAFRVSGCLDFSLIGILAFISDLLAERRIGIFAVSTFNTDYILTKADRFEEALAALKEAGCRVEKND